MRFADIRTEWRVEEIERQLRGKADDYEMHSTNRNVDGLEHTLREIRSLVDGLRSELQTCQDKITQLEAYVEETKH